MALPSPVRLERTNAEPASSVSPPTPPAPARFFPATSISESDRKCLNAMIMPSRRAAMLILAAVGMGVAHAGVRQERARGRRRDMSRRNCHMGDSYSSVPPPPPPPPNTDCSECPSGFWLKSYCDPPTTNKPVGKDRVCQACTSCSAALSEKIRVPCSRYADTQCEQVSRQDTGSSGYGATGSSGYAATPPAPSTPPRPEVSSAQRLRLEGWRLWEAVCTVGLGIMAGVVGTHI